MNGTWSAQQREWLQAMGHSVFQLAGVDAPDEAPARTPDALREAAGLVPESARPVRRAEAARPAGNGDRLIQAVLRAAGAGADSAAVLALVPDAAALRGNAAAKRALWPRLRGLRRSVGTP
ncbi:alanine acetyltransferase [Lysobacter sp. LF1]|uniref:Alanine acetyltransferase n=1 Tax=Lysobacter stagni TaxID=3045172 RepID=A0ABT6XFC9_9GAMM|nr:alanine acetyltransferase [Lysobacter sp. LF1]MDI9238759.1 alanine acetyltransferase [Lysobacter sp. LF1]